MILFVAGLEILTLILVFVLRGNLEGTGDESLTPSEVGSCRQPAEIVEGQDTAVAFEPSLFTTLLIHH
jgi:hypothetical protein